MNRLTFAFIFGTILGLSNFGASNPSYAADFTGLGTNLGGGTSLMPTYSMPDLLTNPFGQATTTTTTIPGAAPGTTTPAKQCNIGGAVLVVNPAPNSPVTLQATISNIGNVTATAGSCD